MPGISDGKGERTSLSATVPPVEDPMAINESFPLSLEVEFAEARIASALNFFAGVIKR